MQNKINFSATVRRVGVFTKRYNLETGRKIILKENSLMFQSLLV